MSQPEHVAVRETSLRARADEWALVLAATGIGCTVIFTSGVWEVRVDAHDVGPARLALDAYDREQAPVQEETPLPDWGPTQAGIIAGLLLILFHLAVEGNAEWYRLGRAVGARILAGEWWRTVTAVMLHANLAHVAGNAVAGGVFLTAVSRLVGPGVAICVAVIAGAGANAVNSLIRPPSHGSLGASTAVFACLGMLSAYQFLRRRRRVRPRGRSWLPLAAGLALLGWLGTGPESDLSGHLLGFLLGGVFGVLLGLRPHEPLRHAAQNGLVLAVALGLGGCWLLAFRFGTPW
jgi:membrane associated rhomboid family serine protease